MAQERTESVDILISSSASSDKHIIIKNLTSAEANNIQNKINKFVRALKEKAVLRNA